NWLRARSQATKARASSALARVKRARSATSARSVAVSTAGRAAWPFSASSAATSAPWTASTRAASSMLPAGGRGDGRLAELGEEELHPHRRLLHPVAAPLALAVTRPLLHEEEDGIVPGLGGLERRHELHRVVPVHAGVRLGGQPEEG